MLVLEYLGHFTYLYFLGQNKEGSYVLHFHFKIGFFLFRVVFDHLIDVCLPHGLCKHPENPP